METLLYEESPFLFKKMTPSKTESVIVGLNNQYFKDNFASNTESIFPLILLTTEM